MHAQSHWAESNQQLLLEIGTGVAHFLLVKEEADLVLELERLIQQVLYLFLFPMVYLECLAFLLQLERRLKRHPFVYQNFVLMMGLLVVLLRIVLMVIV